jgi:hypothetical protein
MKYETAKVDLPGFVRSVFDPTQRMKDLADVSYIRYSYIDFCMSIGLCQEFR